MIAFQFVPNHSSNPAELSNILQNSPTLKSIYGHNKLELKHNIFYMCVSIVSSMVLELLVNIEIITISSINN